MSWVCHLDHPWAPGADAWPTSAAVALLAAVAMPAKVFWSSFVHY